MKVICLGLDTALGACSAALLADGSVLAGERLAMTTGQAETIAPMTQRVAAAAGIAFADITRIGVTTGPGTFTGQRIGLAFARGLALALKIPCVGVTTLEALAAAARARHPGDAVLAVIDARRGEVYAQGFSADGVAAFEPVLLTQDAAAQAAKAMPFPLVLTGTGAPILAALLEGAVIDEDDQPGAAIIAALALAREPAGHPPAPFYLRAPDAKLPGPLKAPPPRAVRP